MRIKHLMAMVMCVALGLSLSRLARAPDPAPQWIWRKGATVTIKYCDGRTEVQSIEQFRKDPRWDKAIYKRVAAP
jgi:hypothetical protein